jgi:hypothetical protein
MSSRDSHQKQDFGAQIVFVEQLHAKAKCDIFISPISKVVIVLD